MKRIQNILILLFITISLYGQDRIYRNFTSHENMLRLQSQDDKIAKDRAKIEKHVSKVSKRGVTLENAIVPVVFHIIYKDDSQKPSLDQVHEQLDILNLCFGNYKVTSDHQALDEEDFFLRVATLDIEFCLADKDPQNNPTDGINYHSTDKEEWKPLDKMKKASEGGINAWNTKEYLNVWIVNLDNSSTGYAQFPGGPKQTDGVVIDYQYFGLSGTAEYPYDGGKTLVHLVGNYLNLHSLWGEGPCQDDYVQDTPIHNAPNSSCPGYIHVSTCDNSTVEMTMNFMDNTDDDCTQMFTYGQKARIYANLVHGGPRAGLLNNNVQCGSSILEDDLVTRQKEPDAIRLKVFPNPVSGKVNYNIQNEGEKPGNLNWLVYNNIGSLIKTITGESGSVNTFNWKNGIYTFLLVDNKKIYSSERIVVVNR
jgi:hypothetical protein